MKNSCSYQIRELSEGEDADAYIIRRYNLYVTEAYIVRSTILEVVDSQRRETV